MVQPGDRVAIVSPSSGLPEIFPAPYELGLQRLRSFGLEPVEYPTTRKMGASPEQRAADLHAAWSDPSIRAVIASIGGDDQLTVLKHLDPSVFRADPKPFFGYSDNTNLLNFLYSLGLPAYHGGSVMVQFGRGGAMHPDTERSLRAALFAPGDFELTPATGWTDHDRDWANPALLETEPDLFPGTGWSWHGSEPVSGRLWGGCLEILDWQLAVDRWMLPITSYDGILFLETSEEMPSDTAVYRILRNFGERGLLERFSAILWGRPKSWALDQRLSADESATYVESQYAAARRALAEYNPSALLVTGLDIGHTDPQQILPYGGLARLDPAASRITVTY
ncbi:muramoyltetrapeptide carboxypeptidase LdcA involved in peptidoglycan recycling [Kribbella antiqua]|uniref:Muramoyltetrapeptide carboxypeptidase LdcA involved in peptidoglycan recycling n=1 Tax=Kribbella antiqua TaxID=2512217 RepID=A0A4R2INS7_9ACTN|nr:S66 peptidase family protein [Kribbella antiqua]TCO46794.1 muramoyltetrapeptide carboxypeptidase LdcA involved in peptidoglycan recycling [Kribbella antiqua]